MQYKHSRRTFSANTLCICTRRETGKEGLLFYLYGWLMVFNATFNNISVISWRSVLLMEETGVPGENPRPVASYIT